MNEKKSDMVDFVRVSPRRSRPFRFLRQRRFPQKAAFWLDEDKEHRNIIIY